MMLSDRIGAQVRDARLRLGMTQPEVARRSGVSTRLVAELERGERPNVGLEAALRILQALGITLRLTGPDGGIVELRGPDADALARKARAAWRRASWTGRHVPLARSGAAPTGGRTKSDRMVAVSRVSRQAHLIARAAAASGRPPIRDPDGASNGTLSSRTAAR